MGKKTYDEDDLERIAGMITEKIEGRIDLLEENTEMTIDRKVRSIVREELNEKLEPIETDIKIIKSAVKSTNHDQRKLERRTAKLETLAHSHA